MVEIITERDPVMHIAHGWTRTTVLVGSYAIKFPNPQVKRRVYQVFGALAHGRFKTAIAKRSKRGFWRYVLSTLLQGFQANQDEWKFYQEHPDLPLAPSLQIFLGGLVLVARRGIPAIEDDLTLWPFQKVRRYAALHQDLVKLEHVCWLDGRLVWVDYGNPASQRQFLAFFGK